MTARQTIDLYATLADMKEVAYKNTLAITALIDLLVEKGIISPEEMAGKAQELDAMSD